MWHDDRTSLARMADLSRSVRSCSKNLDNSQNHSWCSGNHPKDRRPHSPGCCNCHRRTYRSACTIEIILLKRSYSIDHPIRRHTSEKRCLRTFSCRIHMVYNAAFGPHTDMDNEQGFGASWCASAMHAQQG